MNMDTTIGLGLVGIGLCLPSLTNIFYPESYVCIKNRDSTIENKNSKIKFATVHTFKYLTASLCTIGGTAILGSHLGIANKLFQFHPITAFALTFFPTAISLWNLQRTSKYDVSVKHFWYNIFNVMQGISFSTLYYLIPNSVLLTALRYTVMLFSSTTIATFFASFRYESLALPTLIGLVTLCYISFLDLIVSNQVVREFNIYVGLAIYLMSHMYEIKSFQTRVEDSTEREINDIDYINTSLGFVLNFLNTFTRILFALLSKNQETRKEKDEKKKA